MFRRLVRVAMASLLLICAASDALAQSHAPAPNSLMAILTEKAHERYAPFVQWLPPEWLSQVPTLGVSTALEVGTAPIGTSTGSFTYQVDPSTGTRRPLSRTFGPTFAERSLTSGEQGSLSAGFTYLHSGYDSLAGKNLHNGDFVNVFSHDPTAPVGISSLKMQVTSDGVVGFFVYALRDDIDVGVVAPWIRVSMGLTSSTFNVFGEQRQGDLVDDVVLEPTSRAGLGDVAVFGKMRFWKRGEGGLAGAVQLTMPTGDPDNLRGLGVTRMLLSAIWSAGGALAPHASAGYEFWSSGVTFSDSVVARNQFKYAFGLEWLPHPRASVTLDVVGRRLFGGGRIEFQRFATPGGSDLGYVDVLLAQEKGFNVAAFAPGVKYNLWGDVLLTANMLVSLANHGMRANVTPAIGIDWILK